MGQVKVGNAVLEVEADEDAGKPTLLLAHALGGDMAAWDAVAPALRERFRLVRYDARGHGRSSDEGAPYSLDLLGQDALAILDDLGVERAHFLGVSMGGAVGQWLLAHAPHRIERAILANTAARLGTPDVWNSRIRSALNDGLSASVEATVERWFSKDFADGNPEVVAKVGETLRSMSPRGYAAAGAALRDMDLRQSVRRIENPVLIITGADDPTISEEDTATLLAALPQARQVTLPARHMASIEAAPAFAEAVVKFLTSRQASQRSVPRARMAPAARAAPRSPRRGERRVAGRSAATARGTPAKPAAKAGTRRSADIMEAGKTGTTKPKRTAKPVQSSARKAAPPARKAPARRTVARETVASKTASSRSASSKTGPGKPAGRKAAAGTAPLRTAAAPQRRSAAEGKTRREAAPKGASRTTRAARIAPAKSPATAPRKPPGKSTVRGGRAGAAATRVGKAKQPAKSSGAKPAKPSRAAAASAKAPAKKFRLTSNLSKTGKASPKPGRPKTKPATPAPKRAAARTQPKSRTLPPRGRSKS